MLQAKLKELDPPFECLRKPVSTMEAPQPDSYKLLENSRPSTIGVGKRKVASVENVVSEEQGEITRKKSKYAEA